MSLKLIAFSLREPHIISLSEAMRYLTNERPLESSHILWVSLSPEEIRTISTTCRIIQEAYSHPFLEAVRHIYPLLSLKSIGEAFDRAHKTTLALLFTYAQHGGRFPPETDEHHITALLTTHDYFCFTDAFFDQALLAAQTPTRGPSLQLHTETIIRLLHSPLMNYQKLIILYSQQSDALLPILEPHAEQVKSIIRHQIVVPLSDPQIAELIPDLMRLAPLLAQPWMSDISNALLENLFSNAQSEATKEAAFHVWIKCLDTPTPHNSAARWFFHRIKASEESRPILLTPRDFYYLLRALGRTATTDTLLKTPFIKKSIDLYAAQLGPWLPNLIDPLLHIGALASSDQAEWNVQLLFSQLIQNHHEFRVFCCQDERVPEFLLRLAHQHKTIRWSLTENVILTLLEDPALADINACYRTADFFSLMPIPPSSSQHETTIDLRQRRICALIKTWAEDHQTMRAFAIPKIRDLLLQPIETSSYVEDRLSAIACLWPTDEAKQLFTAPKAWRLMTELICETARACIAWHTNESSIIARIRTLDLLINFSNTHNGLIMLKKSHKQLTWHLEAFKKTAPTAPEITDRINQLRALNIGNHPLTRTYYMVYRLLI